MPSSTANRPCDRSARAKSCATSARSRSAMPAMIASLEGKVAIEVAGAHAGLGADLLHRGLVEAGPDEAALGGAENFVPAVGLPLNIQLIHGVIAPQYKENERSFSLIRPFVLERQELCGAADWVSLGLANSRRILIAARHHAAVHDDLGAGDEARLVGGQEQRGIGGVAAVAHEARAGCARPAI